MHSQPTVLYSHQVVDNKGKRYHIPYGSVDGMLTGHLTFLGTDPVD